MNGLVNIVHAFIQIFEFGFIGSKKRFLFVSKWLLGIRELFKRVRRDSVSFETARSLGRALQKLILFRGNRSGRGCRPFFLKLDRRWPETERNRSWYLQAVWDYCWPRRKPESSAPSRCKIVDIYPRPRHAIAS